MKPVLALLLCLLAPPASANFFFPRTIQYDPGGIIVDYISKYNEWRQEGATVRLTGECDSACTILFAFIPVDHICAVKGALFGFHSAADVDDRGDAVYAKAMTEVMWGWYPPEVIAALRPYGMAKPRFHPHIQYITATKIVKECPYG
jgi:hypothetical protein